MIDIEEISITAIPLDGKAPPYSPHRHDPHVGDNVGYLIEDTRSQASLFYAPGLGQMSSALLNMMGGADCVMVDGTFWSEDEMQRAGVGTKLASDMGHLPQSGDEGMLHWLSKIPGPRKILIHINNTNPILIENSPERKLVEETGVEVAYDGMAFDL